MPDVGEHVIYVYHTNAGLIELAATIIAVDENGHCSLSVRRLGRVDHASLCVSISSGHGRYFYE